jgi:hypothetical protein
MATPRHCKVEEKLTLFYALQQQLEKQVDSLTLIEENVDLFVKLIDLFIWGEKNEQVFSDVFIEKNMLNYYLVLLANSAKSGKSKESIIKLMKCYSFFILNIKNPETISYVFSHSNFNNFLKFPFDFGDEEIVFYYTNFVKSLTQKFEHYPFQIFYNRVR